MINTVAMLHGWQYAVQFRRGASKNTSHVQVVNTWSENELGRIIRDYGEEKLWKVVARR